MTDIDIRPTAASEREGVLALVREAFTGDARDGHEEVDLVQRTWALGDAVRPLDLVAVVGDEVVGHVLAAEGSLAGRPVQAIAPLAVTPAHQGHGVGRALVGELLRRADAAGSPMVVLLGSPAYYGRFGFEPSGPLGITYPAVGADNPHFQVRRLASFDPALRGDFAYCWETPTSG